MAFPAIPADVNPARVHAGGEFVGQSVDSLSAALTQVDSAVRALEATWTGRAAATFAQGWQEVAAGAREILAETRAMGEQLKTQAARYRDTDHDGATTITTAGNQIDSNLNIQY